MPDVRQRLGRTSVDSTPRGSSARAQRALDFRENEVETLTRERDQARELVEAGGGARAQNALRDLETRLGFAVRAKERQDADFRRRRRKEG